MKMKNMFAAVLMSALFVFSAQSVAVPVLEMQIIDLGGGLATETFTDVLTPGSLGVTTFDSTILGTYWGTGSLQIAASNNITPSDPDAELISASINLNAIGDLGTNVGIIIEASGYENFTGLGEAFTIINAATVNNTEFDAAVFVDAIEILNVDSINTTDTYTGTEAVTVGSQFSIIHAFDLTSLAVGGDLGFDISTSVNASAVPIPAPLALMGLGIVALGLTRKLRA